MNVTRVRRIEEEVEDPGDLLTLSEVQREYGIEVWRLSMALDKGLLDAYLVPSSNPRKGARQVKRADIEQWIKPILIGETNNGQDVPQVSTDQDALRLSASS